jgi:cysteine-rich repeat protein
MGEIRYLLAGSSLLLALGCGGVCGDGELSKGEACDDGNVVNADGCEADCSLPVCGNGIVDPGELCLTEKRFPVPSIGGDANFIAVGELSGDTKPDIAIALRNGDEVTVVENQGGNNFSAEQVFPLLTGDGPQDLVIADLDANGLQDLVTANQVSNDLSILQNQQNQPFTQELTNSVGTDNPVSVVVGELDGAAGSDLVVLNFGVIDRATVLLNDGLGVFVESPSSPLALVGNAVPLNILVEDANSDGAQDIIALGTDDSFHVFLGQGDGSFLAPSTVPVPGGNISALGIGDINEDNLPDLLAAEGVEGNLLTFINQEGGNFVLDQTFDFSLQASDDFFVVDMDEDGLEDLVLPRTQNGFDVCVGNGDGTFAPPVTFTINELVNKIVVADFNNDSVLDVALTEGLAGEVVVFFSEP